MKKFLYIIMSIFITSFVSSQTVKIVRDKTLLKDGPGNFYDTILVLNINTVASNLGDSKDDPGWIHVSYNNKKGFISKISLKAPQKDQVSNNKDFSNLKINSKQEIAPASFTAAIKGFALDYSNKKGFDIKNIDDLYNITEYKKSDYLKAMNETKLSYFPKDAELLGNNKLSISPNLQAIGLSVSLSVLQKGVVFDDAMTKKLNAIVNILNRQTIDYDIQYRLWIIQDEEPVAFSGPGGYIFISKKMIEIITDYKELVAILAHEVGHNANRHGILNLSYEQAKNKANDAFNELDIELDDETKEAEKDFKEVMDEAEKAITKVRDDKEEFESDDFALELLKRYKIDKSYLKKALQTIYANLKDKYPDYKEQFEKRLKRLDK